LQATGYCIACGRRLLEHDDSVMTGALRSAGRMNIGSALTFVVSCMKIELQF
jgi:hypothetical protein